MFDIWLCLIPIFFMLLSGFNPIKLFASDSQFFAEARDMRVKILHVPLLFFEMNKKPYILLYLIIFLPIFTLYLKDSFTL